ncbi:LysR family transcriptional regulator [Kineococcus auxinigenes]|uniref:LysR family transcriptional regulator n=1 Tax=unclassified Kineococcus TaxID=2621656 RepID=UPI003D7D1CDA
MAAEDVPLQRLPDLDSLQLLLRVASTGSLGRAAAAHGISQPAVSARVRAVERLVGVPLVARSARGSTLTPAGALVADWARDVLQAAAALEAGLASLRDEGDQQLRVAASQTVAEQLLPRWLVHLAAERPRTAVSLRAGNSEEVAAAVRDGAADLGFVEGPQPPPGLASRTVARDRLVVVVAPTHPWARRRAPVDAAELARTPLVQREPRSGTRAALEAALPGHLPTAAPLLEMPSTSAIRSAVAAGTAPAVLSALAVGDDIALGRLVAVPVRDVDLSRSLRAVWVRGARPAGPARDLLAIATARAPGEP